MAISVTFNSVSAGFPKTVMYTGSQTGSGGVIFQSLEELQFKLTPPAPLNINSEEGVMMAGMASWLGRDADLSNAAIVVGKTLIVDMTNVNPFRWQ